MRRKGFTLLELVVAMAIVMILVTIAVVPLDRYVARVRLRFAGMTLVQDLRDMQANAVCEDAFYTIVFVTDKNYYYIHPGTKSYAPPGSSRVERSLSRYAGFPLAAGKRDPVSAVFGLQTSKQSATVTMSYNELGHPANGSGWGHVTLVTPYGDRLNVIVTSADGSARMEWVPR